MKNILANFHGNIIKTLVFTAVLLSIASCSMEKRYHSSGFSVQLKGWDRSASASVKPKSQIKNRSGLSTSIKNKNNALLAEKIQSESPINKELNHQFYTPTPTPNPPASPNYVQNSSQNRNFVRHKPYKIPSLEYQATYNHMVEKAAERDAKSFNSFQWASRLNRWALYSIGIFFGILMLSALLSIPLTGLGKIGRKIFIYSMIGVPGILELASLAALFVGFANIEIGSWFYLQAVRNLTPEMKLRAEASILSARIPYVSKKYTVRTAKTIIQKYQFSAANGNKPLMDVNRTLYEMQTPKQRQKMNADTWQDTKSIGRFLGIALLVTLLFVMMP
ncbi:MAG: hypothetical protein ACK448_01265 [Bacteroidota bacterium]|jgi:hypothetical protein